MSQILEFNSTWPTKHLNFTNNSFITSWRLNKNEKQKVNYQTGYVQGWYLMKTGKSKKDIHLNRWLKE